MAIALHNLLYLGTTERVHVPRDIVKKIRFALLLLKSCHVIESFRVSFRRVSFFFSPSPPLPSFLFLSSLLPFFFLIFLFFFFSFLFFPRMKPTERKKGRGGASFWRTVASILRFKLRYLFVKRFTSPRISNGSVLEKSVCYDFKGKGLGETMPRTRPRAFFPPLFNRRRGGRGEENISHIASPGTGISSSKNLRERSEKRKIIAIDQ